MQDFPILGSNFWNISDLQQNKCDFILPQI